MLKTFNNFLSEQEQSIINQIAQDPLFKLKEKTGVLINQILETLKNILQDTKLDTVKNQILAFKNDLEDINKEFSSAIENQRVLNTYKK